MALKCKSRKAKEIFLPAGRESHPLLLGNWPHIFKIGYNHTNCATESGKEMEAENNFPGLSEESSRQGKQEESRLQPSPAPGTALQGPQ